ncbi:sigma-54-dependent Fis family transcriptional regulator [Ferrimonas sediminicola]|uniref:Sigma-54-dependent Fis family transcriptional regulator n=1 Tax=Ferrimonas sediminicola TaxID=2569538 RepID=A0A4U1B9T2_9GAMM|nr:sigma-54 dependent transcriptional regulator [Ferrimonas sediminicola]TKB47244.1 sigma-54-dependent Fis family transcriptional regulator [Ferrimonas sediminicola]
MSKPTILVVEDDLGLREALVDTLLLGGYRCLEASDGAEALIQLGQHKPAMVISDIQMAGMDGLALLKAIRTKDLNIPVLLMTAYGTIDAAVEAMRCGANDYLAKPFAPEVLLHQVERYLLAPAAEVPQPVVADPASLRLLALAERVAQSDASVMITGPSGSGKEVLARYLHQCSGRAEAPFVAINCAAIPENMLEATLFGYEKGAFTGAVSACAGKFEQAQGGTILLDEITEMDLGLQSKLLRVLQEREVERLGSRKTLRLDVRVLATSNRDLKEAVAQGGFREDLFYRLNVFPLNWLPLNQRPGDIVPLAEHLIARHQRGRGAVPQLSAAARDKLEGHGWPGNVRELENVVQRALILCVGDTIGADDLFIDTLELPMAAPSVTVEEPRSDSLGDELKIQEHQIIVDALSQNGGSRKAVAEQLGISPRTLRYKLAKMREMGIELPA